MNTKFRKIMACFLALAILMTFSQGITAFADELTVTAGDFTLSPTDGITVLIEGTDYTYDNGELTITTTTPVTVGMKDGVTSTNNIIQVWTTTGEADITLNNISIDNSSKYCCLQVNGMVNGEKVTGDNPCTIRLVGTNTIVNGYSFGHAIRTYGENTDLTITSVENGTLTVSNVSYNGTLYAKDGSDLTVCGNVKLTATSYDQSGFEDFGIVTVSENAKVIINAEVDGISTDKKDSDGIIIKDYANVEITAKTSALHTDKTVTIDDNAKVLLKGDGEGVAGIRADNDITISGSADIEIENTGAYGMRSYDASVSVSENAKVSVDTVSGTGIYAETSLNLSDNAEVTVKNAEDFGAAGSDEGFRVSDNVKFTATNVGTGLYSSSDLPETSISGFVQITVDGNSESGIKFNGEQGVAFNISGQPVINVVSSGYGSGINFGKSKATVSGTPVINITGTDDKGDGLYASADGTLVIEGDTNITISGTCENVLNADVTVKGNAVIGSTATAERGIDGDITVTENAKVTIEKATERGVYGDVVASGNGEFAVNSAGEEGIYGNLAISDNAKVRLVAVGTDKVLRYDPVVKPTENMAYKVRTGVSEGESEDSYYMEEETISQKASWRYFHAETVSEIPVSITVNNENTTITYGSDVDLKSLFNIDENAGVASFTVTNVTGEGTQNNDVLTVTKAGTFTVSVNTAVNGIYSAGEAEATLTVNKANHTIGNDDLPKARRINRGKLLSESILTPSEVQDDEGNVIGTYSWAEPDEEMNERGNFVRQVKFTPVDTNNYNEQLIDVTVNVYVSSSKVGSSITHTVSFETNGGSEIDSITVRSNGSITKPVAPVKDGYTFDGWFTDEELTEVYNFGRMITNSITLYAKWTAEETEKPVVDQGTEDAHNCPSLAFTDLDISEWYHLDTDYVIENNLMNGTGETTFAPNGLLTRAMLVTILYRAEGEPATNKNIPFADVDMGEYYANAVSWAEQNGIVNGYSETDFGPDDNITREQIAAIIYRYAQYKGYDISVGENTNILSYDDFDSISEYAIGSMQYAVGSGLIKGRTGSTLNPKDNATRAEIAAILHRFIKANK